MKILDIASRSVVVGLLALLPGCSPQAQQDAPHVIVGAMAKLSGAKKGFLITDGQPTYHDWNAGYGNIAKPLAGADAASFKAFDQPADANTLYARDKSRVYMADLCTPREINGADAKSFKPVTRDGLYAQDAKHVYFDGVPVIDADPSTFEILKLPFAQDKDRAFIGAVPIPNVDRKSWRPLREGWTGDYWYRSVRDVHPNKQESVSVNGWSRDANTFYYGRDPATGIDVATFELLPNYYAKDRNHVYSLHYYYGGTLKAMQGADPATFLAHDDADRVPQVDAHDANSQYYYGKLVKPR